MTQVREDVSKRYSKLTGEIFLAAARSCIEAGYNPLPVYPGTKKPIGKWLPASEERLAKFWGNVSNNEIGIEIPAGSRVAVLEIDCPGEAHPKVKAEAQQEILQVLLPLLADVKLPSERTPSGGWHFWGRVAKHWHGETSLGEYTGIHLLIGHSFVKTFPSKGYTTSETSWPIPVSDLPEFPSEVLALFPAIPAPAKRKPIQAASSHDEWSEWHELLPNLIRTENKGRAICPLHEEAEASLSIWRDREGHLRWKCHADSCKGSRGGTLGDLRRRLWRKAGPAHWQSEYKRAEFLFRAKFVGGALKLLLAILRIGWEREGLRDETPLMLTGPIDVAYRTQAVKGGIGKVLPNGAFSGGSRVKSALLKLKEAGAWVEIGLENSKGGRSTQVNLGPLLKLPP